MTYTTMGSLREVQKLDERLGEIKRALAAFDDRLAEVEEPALALESELSQLTERLAQMESDERRLERSADDKRARAQKMDQRLSRVSNLREEAAVQTELDLIRRAIEGDEQEALQLIDQIRRSEDAVKELEEATRDARVQAGTQQEALLGQRESFSERMEVFLGRRTEVLEHVTDPERRVYDAFHQSGRSVVVAALLEDGACGHCFGVIPLQLQNEIRRSEGLIRCEDCGVILTIEPEPVLDEELEIPAELPEVSGDLEPTEDEDDAEATETDEDEEATENDEQTIPDSEAASSAEEEEVETLAPNATEESPEADQE